MALGTKGKAKTSKKKSCGKGKKSYKGKKK